MLQLLVVIFPVTLGMAPATLLGLVSNDEWRKAYQKYHGGLYLKQRGTTE